MIVKNNGFLTIEQLQDQYLNGTTGNTPVRTTDGKSFQEILESTQGSREVRFSKHAAQRLSNRNIELTKDQKERLQEPPKLLKRESENPWCLWISWHLL